MAASRLFREHVIRGTMEFTVSGKTDTGAGREVNEDSIFFDPERSFALVADGMGGHGAGATASAVSTQTITAYLESREEKGLLDESSILQAAREANARVFWLSTEDERLSGMGATLSLVAWSGSRAIVAHVGDSRVYLYRKGVLRQLMSDRSPLEKHAHTESGRRWLLHMLGQGDQVEVDIFRVKLRGNDVLLLCSDGLHDMVSDAEIGQIISRSGVLPDELCDDLVRAANEHGGEDSISVVVIRVDGAGSTAVRSAVVSGVVLCCLLFSAGMVLRVLPRSVTVSSGSALVAVGGRDTAAQPPEVETIPAVAESIPTSPNVEPVAVAAEPVAAEQPPVEQEPRVPDVLPSEIVEEEARSPGAPSIADMKRLAEDRSLSTRTRVDAYKRAAVMCLLENDLSETRDLLQAGLALDAALSYSADDTAPFELDETRRNSLSGALAEAKRAVYRRQREGSRIETTMNTLGDDAARYVAVARQTLKDADDLAEAGQLSEAVDRIALAEKEFEGGLVQYRKDTKACQEAVESAQEELASLEDLEPWNVNLLESDLDAIALSRNEMLRLSDRGEFRSAIDRAADIEKQVADVVMRAAANREARESSIESLDRAAAVLSALGNGLPKDYPEEMRGRLDRFRRELEDVQSMIATGRFDEAQSEATRICEKCRELLGDMFQVLEARKASLVDELPPDVSDGIEVGGVDSVIAAADAVELPAMEAVPELLRLFRTATEAMDALQVAVREAVKEAAERDAAWRREAARYLDEVETHIVRVKERLQQAGGSDQALKFWLDKCKFGPLNSLGELSDVSEGFAEKLGELRILVEDHAESRPFRISDGDVEQIEGVLAELSQIVRGGTVGEL